MYISRSILNKRVDRSGLTFSMMTKTRPSQDFAVKMKDASFGTYFSKFGTRVPDDVPCFSSYFDNFLKGGNEGFSIYPRKIDQIFQLRKVELGNILYFSVIEFCFDTCLSKFVSRVPSCVPILRFFL